MSDTQTWDKDRLNQLFLRDDHVGEKAIRRALMVLYARQTQDERAAGMTKLHNGVGFSGTDAAFLSAMAQRVQRGYDLTPNMLRALRKPNRHGHCCLAKYWRQLVEEIERKRESNPVVSAPAPIERETPRMTPTREQLPTYADAW